jgi:hypothetical protein
MAAIGEAPPATIDFEKTFAALTAALRKLETNPNIEKRRLDFELVCVCFFFLSIK